jgi:polar amino acid transport system substrate-binding protein
LFQQLLDELAPTGRLRAAINMGNSLLVTGQDSSGLPKGVAPDLAAAVARQLGVEVTYIPFERPGPIADAAGKNVWDIALIGADPARAEQIAFSAAYAEIEATYLVPRDSELLLVDDVDRPDIRISVSSRSAYDLWLQRNIKQASLISSQSIEASFIEFVDKKMDALAGLRTRLLLDAQKFPGSRILGGSFMTIQQAIGTFKMNKSAIGFLQCFVEESKASGLIYKLIDRHKVQGLSVAPAVERGRNSDVI